MSRTRLVVKPSLGSGYPIEEQGPTGTYPAVLADMDCRFDVERPSFDDPNVMEKKDLVRLLFAYNADGKTHFCQTFDMTMSASEKSRLFKTLKDLRGSPPPFDGDYDFLDEIGGKCQITVSQKTSRKGTVYLTVDGVSQILKEVEDKCPDLNGLEIPGGRKSELPETEEGGDKTPF